MNRSVAMLMLLGMVGLAQADGVQSLSVQIYNHVDLSNGTTQLPQPQIEQRTVDRSGDEAISQTLDDNGKHFFIKASPSDDPRLRQVAIETVVDGVNANGINTRVTKKSSMVVELGKPGLMQVSNGGDAIGICVATAIQCPSIQLGRR